MKYEKRNIEELNLMDDFLFFEAVSGDQGEWFCRLLIKAICNKDVGNIYIHPQNVIQGIDVNRHGIRMDLYVDEDGKCLYDFEPDKYSDSRALPRRNRYYRALLDGKLLDAGKEYIELPDMWTIFILTRDPFGKNRMCYTVRNCILEDSDIEFKDGAVSLFLYTRGQKGQNENLAQLLNYMEKSVRENAVTKELKKLHNYVQEIKHKKEVGVRYMKSWEYERMIRERSMTEGRAEGRAEGRTEGRVESVLELLGELGEVSPELRNQIMKEKDFEILRKWLRISANAKTIEEFEGKMNEVDDRG